MRSLWKGALSFGLVNIPIRLVATTRETRVKFRQLHAEDLAPVKYERRCSLEDKPLEREEIVRGVEVGKDAYVVVTDEEWERVEPESSRTLSINEFVDADAVDPVYRERSYAIEPQAGGERAYVLLHEALRRRGNLAIGKLTLRNREHLVAVRPGEDRLLFLDLLHYDEEVHDLGEIEGRLEREADATGEELELAELLVARLHREWDPSRYEDAYAEAVRELVDAKLRGEALRPATAAPRPPTTDLLKALRETLEREEAEAEAA